MKSLQDITNSSVNMLLQRYNAASNSVSVLTEVTKEYKEAAQDLLVAKARYVELVNKYSFADRHDSYSAGFAKLATMTPISISPDMQQDTQEVRQLSDMIIELSEQVDMLYARMRKFLEAAVTTSSAMVDVVVQTSDYLSTQISSSSNNGAYGSSSVLNYINNKEKRSK